MGLGNVLRNIRDRGLQDITDPNVIKAYMEWAEIKKNGIHLDADEIESFAEQVVYRMGKCPECVQAGECHHCHCPMPQKALTPLAVCSAGAWPRMMPPEDWKAYKIENKIQTLVIGG